MNDNSIKEKQQKNQRINQPRVSTSLTSSTLASRTHTNTTINTRVSRSRKRAFEVERDKDDTPLSPTRVENHFQHDHQHRDFGPFTTTTSAPSFSTDFSRDGNSNR